MAKKKVKQKHGIPGEIFLSSPPDSATERPSWLIIQSYCMVEEAKKHQLSKKNKRKLFSLFWEECKIGRENITDFVEAVVSINEPVRIGLHEKYDSLYEDLEKLVRKSLRERTANIDEFFKLYELQIRLMLKRRVISKIEADARVRDMKNGFALLAKEPQNDLEADLKAGDKIDEPEASSATSTHTREKASKIEQNLQTPDTDSSLIYQCDAALFYNIPKSMLSKAAKKNTGQPGYLWSDIAGRRRFYRKADLQRISRSRQKLKGV